MQQFSKRQQWLQLFISTGNGEEWMDPRGMWELKTTRLGDFFLDVKNEKEGRKKTSKCLGWVTV